MTLAISLNKPKTNDIYKKIIRIKNNKFMAKIVKLSGRDVKQMVEQIIEESKKINISQGAKKPVPAKTKIVENKENPKKIGRVIRLTESEMIEFLDKLAAKLENSRLRRISK